MGKPRSFLTLQRLILVCAGFLLYGKTLTLNLENKEAQTILNRMQSASQYE